MGMFCCLFLSKKNNNNAYTLATVKRSTALVYVIIRKLHSGAHGTLADAERARGR